MKKRVLAMLTALLLFTVPPVWAETGIPEEPAASEEEAPLPEGDHISGDDMPAAENDSTVPDESIGPDESIVPEGSAENETDIETENGLQDPAADMGDPDSYEKDTESEIKAPGAAENETDTENPDSTEKDENRTEDPESIINDSNDNTENAGNNNPESIKESPENDTENGTGTSSDQIPAAANLSSAEPQNAGNEMSFTVSWTVVTEGEYEVSASYSWNAEQRAYELQSAVLETETPSAVTVTVTGQDAENVWDIKASYSGIGSASWSDNSTGTLNAGSGSSWQSTLTVNGCALTPVQYETVRGADGEIALGTVYVTVTPVPDEA